MPVWKPTGSKFYHARFQLDGRTFRFSTGKTSKQAAQRELERRRVRAQNDASHQDARVKMTLLTITERYWEEVAEGQTSSGTTVSQMNRLLDYFGENTLVHRIDANWILKYVTARKRQVAPASVNREIELLRRCKEQGLITKTGIMVGIGEKDDEVVTLMRDVQKRAQTDILTIGQYLQPTRNHLPIDRWVTPEQFEMYKQEGLRRGFKVVESGPLVRSSYHAERHV